MAIMAKTPDLYRDHEVDRRGPESKMPDQRNPSSFLPNRLRA